MHIQSKERFYSLFVVLFFTLVFLSACSEKNNDTPASVTEQKNKTVIEAVPVEGNAEGVVKSSVQSIEEFSDSDLPSWSQHIQSHSQGWVPAERALEIRFSHPVVSTEQLNLPVEGLVSITPAVEFTAVFTAPDTLTLAHPKRFPSAKVYSIQLMPQKLEGVSESLGAFNFQVQVLKQDFELKIAGLTPGDTKNVMVLDGSIKTSDTSDDSEIEKTLNLKQADKDLPITWRHSTDKLSHDFTINGIVRGDKASTLDLHYSAQSIDVEKDGIHSIDVPAINQFVVTGIRTIQYPEQYVEVSFSEGLDRNQNLVGLIQLDGKDANVRVDGSSLRIYPAGIQSGELELEIADTIKSSKSIQLPTIHKAKVTFVSELPGVRFLSGGSIIPPSDSLTVPFEAINVNAVWVTAFKTFEHGMQEFLQSSQINSSHTYQDEGRYLWRKKITLPSIPFDQWQRFDIDMNELMEKHGDGLINLSLSIDNTVVAYTCPASTQASLMPPLANYDGPNIKEDVKRPSWFNQYYSTSNGYVTYSQRNDPCDANFYTYYNAKNVKATKNFLVSDLGLLVKKGSSNKYHIVATGIQSGEPRKKAKITVYNYQHQIMAEGTTDKNGMLTVEPKGAAFYLIAEYKNDKGYIRFPRNEALPTSQFDTRGEKIRKGIKGFIFGERDVWRPGDDIFLTFVLQDKNKSLPEGHPVSIDFFDPRGTKVTTQTNSQSVGNLYTFTLKTEESSPTGAWRAVVRVGGEYFAQSIKIETIVPNRLKVDVRPAQRPLLVSSPAIRTELFAQWLNGASAKGLKADSEIKLSPMKTTFEGWSQYHFDDPASSFRKSKHKLFDGHLDDNGRVAFNVNLQHIVQAPGKLRATFVTRVFEQSGNFSTSIRHEEVLPYENWVGLNIPKGDGYRGAISRNQDHSINLQAINSDAKSVEGRTLDISIYKIGWRWWWDQTQENFANYVNGRHTNELVDETVVTDAKGHAEFILEKNLYGWGRHLIRVCDRDSGHCSGKEVYLGWSWSNQVNPDSATQLMLATDKTRYSVGDTAIIQIPELIQGKMLLSIETGSEVLQQKWLNLKPGATSFEVPITADMAPNVYINAMLLLPHSDRKSDAPIRLYGITPLLVDNPKSHLTPVLDAPDSVRPSSTFEVTVSEENNRDMSYTLAVVDEGLLGITGYKAPDPHKTFYKRESLGVVTWDIFDGVIGSYGANLERLLRIGGGDGAKGGKEKKQRRFPPVVKFLGAFTLKPGETKTHSIELPQYMGAVRVMAVAADSGAYGQAEKTIIVTQPLTLLATLPRVLGPKEKVSLPVNIFVNNDKIKTVDIKVTTNNLFTIKEETKTLTFDGPGDQIVMLELDVRNQIGAGRVTVVAESGDERAEQTIHIESRSPNVESTEKISKLLQPGEEWKPILMPHGMDNTNIATVAVSSLPPLNISERMRYLIRYPHGCVEQTTSAIFPQIWLSNITELSEAQKSDIQKNVTAAIIKYRGFQQASGNFSYWPGGGYTNDWATNYVTHFLVEAKSLGYAVPTTMIDSAVKYLGGLASSFDDQREYSRLVAAYRLYVLAIAGSPDLAAMNRLREAMLKKQKYYNDSVGRWQLALAYQKLGLSDVAQELMNVNTNDVQDYRYGYYTYGSSLRDRSILLMAYNAAGKDSEAWGEAKEIATLLSQKRWYSTHSTAWAFLAISQYADNKNGDSNRFSISENANKNSANKQKPNKLNWQGIESISTVYQHKISPEVLTQSRLMIRNDSERPLHASVSNIGVPSDGGEIEKSSGLTFYTNFTDMDGNPINVDALPQGQDFIAEVAIIADTNKHSYKIEDIAMTMVMPSGWQIRNERLEGEETPKGLDYQDIRDDRVLSYFSLWQNHYWRYRYNDRSQDTQTIRVILNASFAGKFYLPGWQVKSMYDDEISAQSAGQWVEVISESQAKSRVALNKKSYTGFDSSGVSEPNKISAIDTHPKP